MKPIHDSTLVLNKIPTGYDPVNYPRLDDKGNELPGHGVYVVDEEWIQVIEERNQLLFDVDKVLNSRLSKKKKEAFAEYRKKLESIEQDFDDPEDVVLPDYPKK